MKTLFALGIALSAMTVAGCSQSPADNLAERVEDAADNRADAMEGQADALENQADALEDRAEQIRDTGEQRADAIGAADRNVSTMTQKQRDAIIANDAAAVR